MDAPNEPDATPPGVSGEQEVTETTTPENEQQPLTAQEPQGEPPLSPREEAMNRIVGMREQGLGEEVQASEQPDSDDDSDDPSESLQTLKVKVDGIEKEIPIEQATAVVQKNFAADKRLNDAALKQQQLTQWEQQLKTREEKLLATPAPQAAPPEDVKEKVQIAVDKLYDGDTDEAVEALTSLVSGRGNAATLNPETISAQVIKKVDDEFRQRDFRNEVETGNKQFASQYPHIINDPELLEMADGKTIELMKQHPELTPTQVIMEAGRQVDGFVNRLRGSNGTQQSRLQRKAQLQSLPRSQGSVAYQQPEPAKGPNTPTEVIANMRQARGQQA